MEKGERIVILDSLRGFALLGILYAHMIIWYTGAALPKEVYINYKDTGSLIAFAIFGALVFGKFFTVFSLLFGFTFYLQLENSINKNQSFTPRFCMRLSLLFSIGLIHQIFWRGDILMIYGLLGLLLLIAVRLPDNILLITAGLFTLNIPGIIFPLQGNENLSLPMEQDAYVYYKTIKYGSFAELMKDNVRVLSNKFYFQIQSGRLLRTAGFMLLGLYAARQKWFITNSNDHHIFKVYKSLEILLIFILLAAALLFFSKVIIYNPNSMEFVSKLPLHMLYEFSNIVLTLFYITGMYILFRRSECPLLKLLSYPGKMSLTTYLFQTIIGVLIFYNVGLHLFEKTSPVINAILTIPVFMLQVLFSKYWLNYFNYGPVEWLWRSYTYLKW